MKYKYIDCIQIPYDGTCFSCVSHENEYIATIRQHTQGERNVYPECYNKCFILKLDSSFNILSSNLLDESIKVETFQSYSKGIEDSRLLDNKSMTAVSLDTNPNWKPEMCYIEFENFKITKLIKMYIDGEQYTKIEKNWVYLKRNENIVYFLYWYNPFQIISVDILTGKGNKILSYDIPGLSLNAHGGSCVYLENEKKYLVLIRNFEGYSYINSTWLLFDEDFYLKGISDNFRFSNNPGLEFCISFIMKNNILHICISINEAKIFIYTIELNEILNSIKPITM